MLRFYTPFIFLVINSSCLPFFIKGKEVENNSQFYVGVTSTQAIQKITSNIFLNNLYTIDEYYNSSTETKIISNWKINYFDDFDSNNAEYKTRFILIGLIDNTSFNQTSAFKYECYLECENYYFNGNEYIEDYTSNFIIEEMRRIEEELIVKFKK